MVPFWASTDSGFVPNLGPHIRSHAVWRRLFIFLMTAAHISPNIFSLWNFLSNIHVLLSLYINRHSYILYITFLRAIYIFFIYIHSVSLFLQVFMAGRLPSVHCVRYSFIWRYLRNLALNIVIIMWPCQWHKDNAYWNAVFDGLVNCCLWCFLIWRFSYWLLFCVEICCNCCISDVLLLKYLLIWCC
jgi:hypothetical protein